MAGQPLVESADIGRVFREEHGRAVAILIRLTGDISLAEVRGPGDALAICCVGLAG